ncbi:MAG TPA: hypothetical protein PKD55_02505 [Bellilinea sp.]|nr:hypothetical protein [Bellilinea sp.]
MKKINFSQKTILTVILALSLVFFQMFTFSTTEYSLRSLLGNPDFYGFPWAMLLALAFAGADFAGMARIFTPERGKDEPLEVWILTGAWLAVASLNAVLTWYGVGQAMLGANVQGSELISRAELLEYVPITLAMLTWIVRILLVSTFSFAMEGRVKVKAPKQNFGKFPPKDLKEELKF